MRDLFGDSSIFEIVICSAIFIIIALIIALEVSLHRDNEDYAERRSEKRRKQIEKIQHIKDYEHAAKKLFRHKKKLEARTFSVHCFKYLRTVLFVVDSILAISFFDTPIILNGSFNLLAVLNLTVLFFILTIVLYVLSLIYMPLLRGIYYIIHINNVNPYNANDNMRVGTRKLYMEAKAIEKSASELWSAWWCADYVKRSRIAKIFTTLACGSVVYLKSSYLVENEMTFFFKNHNFFAENMSTEEMIIQYSVIIGFLLIVYFLLWLSFYFSDKMILKTHLRNSAVVKHEYYKEKLQEYWRENDPEELKRYNAEVEKFAEDHQRFLDSMAFDAYMLRTQETSSRPSNDDWIPTHIDVSDY